VQREIARLVGVFESNDIDGYGIIDWSCPVPYFGHLETAKLATVGINPSNREFVTANGTELNDADRRLPTLTSLGLHRWSEADDAAIEGILSACSTYFEGNPYDGWFRSLQRLMDSTGRSYYSPVSDACHLDLVPWATSTKWGQMLPASRRHLVSLAAGALGELIKDSSLLMLVLNGREVVRQFQLLTECRLSQMSMPAWDLPRHSGSPVRGIAYSGWVDRIGPTALGRQVRVVGWNHNVQSSFGVTSRVRADLRSWLGEQHSALSW
jgi:hypothetical protein